MIDTEGLQDLIAGKEAELRKQLDEISGIEGKISDLEDQISRFEDKIAEISVTANINKDWIESLKRVIPSEAESAKPAATSVAEGKGPDSGADKTGDNFMLRREDILDLFNSVGPDHPGLSAEDVLAKLSETSGVQINMKRVSNALGRLKKSGVIEALDESRPLVYRLVANEEGEPLATQESGGSEPVAESAPDTLSESAPIETGSDEVPAQDAPQDPADGIDRAAASAEDVEDLLLATGELEKLEEEFSDEGLDWGRQAADRRETVG